MSTIKITQNPEPDMSVGRITFGIGFNEIIIKGETFGVSKNDFENLSLKALVEKNIVKVKNYVSHTIEYVEKTIEPEPI